MHYRKNEPNLFQPDKQHLPEYQTILFSALIFDLNGIRSKKVYFHKLVLAEI